MNIQKLTPLEISQVFRKVLQINQERLAFGLQDRERIKTQLANGEQPTGYRAKWILKSSLTIIDLLANLSMEFNEQHEKDRASIHDFIDILLTSLNRLKEEID